MELLSAFLNPSSKKFKKIHPEKISYISGNGTLWQQDQKIYYILSKKLFLYFRKWSPHQKISYISEKLNLLAPSSKNRKNPSKKVRIFSYILGNETF